MMAMFDIGTTNGMVVRQTDLMHQSSGDGASTRRCLMSVWARVGSYMPLSTFVNGTPGLLSAVRLATPLLRIAVCGAHPCLVKSFRAHLESRPLTLWLGVRRLHIPVFKAYKKARSGPESSSDLFDLRPLTCLLN